MHLKSIEIQGFKSFANKINLSFDTGITGIVGPNGSGKSNVADAVRWVLGEQSAKQLRGAKMEDVIFAGTENRKALGYASVSITIDNDDGKLAIEFKEVTVTRRVYRSGESEYLINGSPSRLKDIHELFFDTGIGKEGYSIIGQGQIDQILSGKPEERRELFDEAAGIVKFKKRKSVAEKKLDDEKQNLYRVNDILGELEKQVGPLKEQSETAKIYLELREKQKIYDLNLFLLEMDKLKETTKQVDERIVVVRGELDEANRKHQETKDTYGQMESSVEELSNQIATKKEGLNQLQIDTEKLDNEKKLLLEQINSIQKNEVHIHQRKDILAEEVQEKEKDVAEYILKKQENLDKIAEINQSYKIESSLYEQIQETIMQKEANLEQYKASIIEILGEIGSINNKIQRYDTLLEQIGIRKAALNQRFIKNQMEEEENQTKLSNLEVTCNTILEEMESMVAEQEAKATRLESFKKEYDKNNQSAKEYQESLHKLRSKHDTLKDITDQYEGYNYSIRKIMELRDHNKGIIGVVADILTVSKEYEVAVETALGGSIQNIVTDNTDTAKALVEYLKKNKYGRATFLPLTSIQSKTSFHQENVLKEEGVIGLASNLVEAAKIYGGLVESLLGRVIVVRDMHIAVSLAKKYKYTLRMVTLEGELINPGGSITGGSFKNNHYLLGRRRELEELLNQIQKYDQALVALKHTLDEIERHIGDINAQIGNLKEAKQQKEMSLQESQLNMRQCKKLLEDIQAGKEDIQSESYELEQQILDIEGSKQTLLLEKEALQSKDVLLQSDSKFIASEIASDKEKEKLQQDQLSQIKMEVQSFEQEQNYVQDNILRLNKEKDKLLSEQKNILETQKQNVVEIEFKQLEIGKIEEEISQMMTLQDEQQKVITSLVSDRDEKNLQLKQYFSLRESLTEQLNLLDKELYRLTSQQEKVEEQSTQMIQYIWDEYGLTNSEANSYTREDFGSIQILKKLLHETKSGIKGLGDVNVNAIEDYKNLVERHCFLTEQRDDLILAEENLHKIIEELDIAMRNQFSIKFKEIQAQFDGVFKELFGGGKATLELVEHEDILEAGIRIIAQPPGKKLQNMMQLSGGEKAFTAIALLFAIQRLKPSPFCLLDEIEAALDDANVFKFSEYLKTLTADTQFIVITHRKGTMEAADALYGITMQEKGISTLVSVKLIEKDI